jgi:hypothetical protein
MPAGPGSVGRPPESGAERGWDERRPQYESTARSPRGARRVGLGAGAVICFALGTVLILFLMVVPLFNMISLNLPNRDRLPPDAGPKVGGMVRLTEGAIYLYVTTFVAGFCLNGLLLYLVAPGRLSANLVTTGACVAAGSALTLLLWTGGFIWDIFVVNNWILADRPDPSKVETIAPGLGLWLGLGAAGVGVAVFVVVICLRGKPILLVPALVGGLAAGVLLVTVDVQPWNPGPSRKEINEFRGEPKDRPRAKAQTRYARLFWMEN